MDDPVKDAAIKVYTPVTGKSAKELKDAVTSAKLAVDKAKKAGENYGFKWDAAYGGPDKCEEAFNGPKIWVYKLNM